MCFQSLAMFFNRVDFDGNINVTASHFSTSLITNFYQDA